MAKYDATVTAKLVTDYKAGREAGKSNEELIKALSESLEKSAKSVRGKLVREGVYIKDPEAPKETPKDTGPTKTEILAKIREKGVNTDGAENANKDFLKNVLIALGGEAE